MYTLNYEQSCKNSTMALPGASRVTSVEQCSDVGGGPAVCKPPVQLSWSQGCTGAFAKSGVGPATKIGPTLPAAQTDVSRVLHGDFDNNGLTDTYYVAGYGAAATGTLCALAAVRTRPSLASLCSPLCGLLRRVEFLLLMQTSTKVMAPSLRGRG